jgi:hypothetical protein
MCSKKIRNWIILILILPVLFVLAVFLFIPKQINISVSVPHHGNPECVQRMIGGNRYRMQWLPKDIKQVSANVFLLDGCTIRFPENNQSDNFIGLQFRNFNGTSQLYTLPEGDSGRVSLAYKLENNNNPFLRIRNYFTANQIREVCNKVLTGLQEFVRKPENVYGLNMYHTILHDSTLISIKSTSLGYPSVTEIYKQIAILKSYAAAKGALETSPPMLNILPETDHSYSFMVALPLNKLLENNGKIIAKRMLAGGKIIETAPIKGGPRTIEHFIMELENYRADTRSLSPAIPYQSLLTDRSVVADSSQWITRLYYPVY